MNTYRNSFGRSFKWKENEIWDNYNNLNNFNNFSNLNNAKDFSNYNLNYTEPIQKIRLKDKLNCIKRLFCCFKRNRYKNYNYNSELDVRII